MFNICSSLKYSMLRRNTARVDAPANSVFCMFSACQIHLHCSRLLRYSAMPEMACTACSARCVRESKSSRLLRPKHANANSFALLSASAIFGYAGNTVHASAMQAWRLALPVPPAVSVSPRSPGSSARNMPMQMNLHCSRLLRIFVPRTIRYLS